MNKLRIAQIVPPFIPVPPQTHGGTEAVVSNLTEELVKRGHDVTLFASGDSQTKAHLFAVFPKALAYEELNQLLSPLARNLNWMDSLPAFYHTVSAFEQAGNFDIIHDHTHYVSPFFSQFTNTSMVSTYHGAFPQAEQSPIEKMLLEKYKANNWIAISENQKKHTTIPLNFVATIHHGIPIERFPYSLEKGEYLIWLGRITERKGVKEAILLAKETREKMIIAGVVKERDQAYFQKEILPLIDNSQITYVGPVDHEKKVELLQHAKALIYPLSWEEPFGIVLLEAMACGTPVIAYNRGAVSEIVENGVTGFITSSYEDMAETIFRIDELDRKKCRELVEARFTVGKMVDKYEETYQHILNRKR